MLFLECRGFLPAWKLTTKNVIQSTVKHIEMSENKNLGACVCVTRCLCVLHTYNIKRHLPGPEAVLALLPSLLLLLWFIFSPPSLIPFSYIVIAEEWSCIHLRHTSHTVYDHMIKHSEKSSQPTDKKTEHCFLFLSLSLALAHTNEVNEDECGGTVLLTSCVCNCGPVLQGHGGKDKQGEDRNRSDEEKL